MKKTKLSEMGAIEQMSEDKMMFSAMYGSMAARLKPKGSNYTPPKKKRKKK